MTKSKTVKMRWLFLTISFTLLTSVILYGQISTGGKPMAVPSLKSSGIPKILLLEISNEVLREQEKKRQNQDIKLKSLRFAHSFDVNISPLNDGIWTYNIQGYDIWRVNISSPGALSLNIIFDNFKLHKGARLFLFNEQENHFLGAFTSANNKPFEKFAVSPLAGDEVTIQYEIPSGINGKNDFIIKRINHDFIGILKFDERRPSGELPGDCHIDINCMEGADYADPKDAVCRFISGIEICTGTLINNTAENQKPYLITAAHCIKKPEDAQTAVFTFNYESPYCGIIDGDPSNSISGAVIRAFSDSLDFALLELSIIPPPEFRPYYAGWDRETKLPDSTASIHHPQGYIKKIAKDRDKPVLSDFTESYTKNGFLKVVRWDSGVTEDGSSGCSLLNPSKNIIGTLTGGYAMCYKPEDDRYSRFDMAWEYRSEPSKQLKYWLDPLNSGVKLLRGKRFYQNEKLCLPFTNLTDDDIHDIVRLIDSGQSNGYWGGSNSAGISVVAERFSIKGDEKLYGVSLGVGKSDIKSTGTSEISINVYDGHTLPELLIHSQKLDVKDLVADAMNFIRFDQTVEPSDTFFVGIELTGIQPQDTFALYQSLRSAEKDNYFYFNIDGNWYDFKNYNTQNYSMSNVMEIVACNAEKIIIDTPLVNNPSDALIYPNPVRSVFTFEAGRSVDPENFKVFNLIGQEIKIRMKNHREKKIDIDLTGNVPGIYFVRYIDGNNTISKKVTYIPW
ncbi:MAG: T9SS type A sorting domain-containing protein [Prolixibacteraceae bacterium]|nr:T9SS type A sorting domain-containing protein [Prolixibacteraceae bacterium]